ncbi:GAF domain-containing protein [Halopseudomonas salina]|nr:GAF domain-containing protein [Halopseudomonas salina]
MSTEQESKNAIEHDIGSLRQSLNSFVLPIEKSQQVMLCNHLESEMLNLSELTAMLLRVPAAALQVCRIAGEAARRRDIDILTLEHACNMLGTQRLGTIIKELPVLEAEHTPYAYRQLLSISEHALSQAQGLFAHRMARLWHEVSLASLLFLAPCWVLVYQRPEVFAEWDARHLDQKTNGNGFSHWLLDSDRVLGLAQQLAEDWWLPPWILQGYRSLGSSRRTMVRALHIARDSQHPRDQQAALDADRSLYRWLTLPANSLLMANGLALGAHHDWDARHTRRWQQLTALYLGQQVAEVQTASHANAVESARSLYRHYGNSVWLPAEALIWPCGSRQNEGRGPERLSAASPDGINNAQPLVGAALWRKNCLSLVAQPPNFTSLAAIVDTALQAVTQGLGSDKCWIALYNARKHQLTVYAAAGFAADRDPVGVQLGECRGNAWGRWLQSSTSHDLSIPGRHPNKELVPPQLARLTGDGASSLFPLLHKGQIIGLLGSQSGTAPAPLDEKHRKALIKTAECLSRALVGFMQKP